MRQAIFDFLQADAGLTAVIGDNIFYQVADAEASFPYVTTRAITIPHSHHLGGSDGLALNSIFEFSCFGEQGSDAQDASEAIRQAIDGFRGLMGSIFVRSIFFIDDTDIFQSFVDSSQQMVFQIDSNVSITFEESIP